VSDVAPDVGRHAVLVDAGYLYASVGQLVLGRTSRRDFRVSAEGMIGALLARADRTTPGELLRMYWYDAARDRVPTVEQRQIAALPHVKVRLGNLNSAGQQKGVDAQLRQDLEVLARHRAVTDVVLIAGDEDMVPAVEAAQAYGVRVHVWGVEPPYGVNQAERLVWEADTVDQLDAEFCRPHVDAEPAPADEAVEPPEPREDKPVVPTPADVFAGRKLPAPAPAAAPPKPVAAAPSPPAAPGPERPEMEAIGARIAARWLLTRGRENVADLLPGPVLPTVIDKELLVEAEEEISRSLRPYEEARRALRDGFWAKLQQEFGIAATPHPVPDHPGPPTSPPASPTPAGAATGPALAGAAPSGPAPAGAAPTGPAGAAATADPAPAGATAGPAPAGATAGPAPAGAASSGPAGAAASGPAPAGATEPSPGAARPAPAPGAGPHPGPVPARGAQPAPAPGAGSPPAAAPTGPAGTANSGPGAARPTPDAVRPGPAGGGATNPGPAQPGPGQPEPAHPGSADPGPDGASGAGRNGVRPAAQPAPDSTPARA
jgi:uncharacterized LabA/DUF88 family protein